MAYTVTSDMVAAAVEAAIPRLATELPRDVLDALKRAYASEQGDRGRAVLAQLVDNARIACADHVPICQDTGTVWVSLEVGPDVMVAGDVFSGVNGAVARAYEMAHLRKSLVRDAILDRANTGNNTPAFTDIHPVDQSGVVRLRIMLKGGGSDNASRVVMLVPGAGRRAIVDELVKCVREKAANACAPLVIGVGIGGTFDKVAGLAKRALMRPIDEPASDEGTRQLERELLEAVNKSGVGPQGLGGNNVALAVRVATAPCHIAALPLAINMGCSAMRRATIDLTAGNDGAQLSAQLIDADEADCAHQGDASNVSDTVTDQKSGTVPAEPIRLHLPFAKDALATLRAGDACLLTGVLYTLRDAGHERLLHELESTGSLPYGLAGQTIFYAGPTPAAAGRPFGAVGPTTASRMDFAASVLHDAGIVATIGKGHRSKEVLRACERNGAVYFVSTGGAAALLAKCVVSSEIVAYDDLGTEALRRIEVVDFPVFVGIDTAGNDVYEF